MCHSDTIFSLSHLDAEQMSEGDAHTHTHTHTHTQVGPKPKLNPWGAATKEEGQKCLPASVQAVG